MKSSGMASIKDFRLVWSCLVMSGAISIQFLLRKEKGGSGIVVLVLFSTVFISCLCQVYERYMRYGDWPSPKKTLPVLGNAIELAPALIRFLVRESRRHADGGLFLFWPGGPRPTCVIANARAAKEVLGASSTFPKGNDYTHKFHYVFGDGLVTSTGETHSRARRLLGRFFIKAKLEKRSTELRAMVDTLLDHVLKSQFSGGATEITIDVQDVFHFVALQIFCSAMLSIDMRIFATRECPILGDARLSDRRADFMKAMRGSNSKLIKQTLVSTKKSLATRLAEEDDHYAHPGEVMRWFAHEVSFGSELVGRHIIFGIPMTKLLPTVRRLTNTVKKTHEFFRHCIAARRTLLAANGYKIKDENSNALDDSILHSNVPDDCLTALVKAADEGDESTLPRLTDTQVCHQLVTLVSAGHDTTAFFCCYGSLLLARHPQVQADLRAELMAAEADSTAKFDFPRSLLKRVFQETLRLYPTIPMVTRTAAKDVKLSRYADPNSKDTLLVPKGSNLLIPFFLLHRNSSIWGNNAADFDPDRWIKHNTAPLSDGIMHPKLGFLPFAYGSRTCIGYTLSLVEAKLIFTSLLRDYELKPVPGFTPRIRAGISLTVENPHGIKVRFSRRRPAAASPSAEQQDSSSSST